MGVVDVTAAQDEPSSFSVSVSSPQSRVHEGLGARQGLTGVASSSSFASGRMGEGTLTWSKETDGTLVIGTTYIVCAQPTLVNSNT